MMKNSVISRDYYRIVLYAFSALFWPPEMNCTLFWLAICVRRIGCLEPQTFILILGPKQWSLPPVAPNPFNSAIIALTLGKSYFV